MEGLSAGSLRRPIPEPLRRVLSEGRDGFNRRFEAARRNAPALEPAVFLDLLGELLPPVAEAVDRAAPARLAKTVDALYDLALELQARRLLSGDARATVVREGWRRLLPAFPKALAASPRVVAGALTNALLHLLASPTQGGRPEDFIQGLLGLAPLEPDVTSLLEAGRAVAWRSGAAPQRARALRALRTLPAPLASAALGLPSARSSREVNALLTRLEADPWLHPLDGGPSKRGVRIVAEVGGFIGFGGPFPAPPRVAAHDGTLLLSAGDGAYYRLFADRFGAGLVRVAEPARPKPTPGALHVDRPGKVSWKEGSATIPELADASSAASTADTLAVTLPFSHRAFVVAAVPGARST